MAKITDKPWDGSKSRWPDAASLARCSLVNLNTGPESGWTKDKVELPYKEPDGTINKNGVAAAVGRLPSADIPASAKKAAAAKLRSIYREMGVKPADQPKTLSRY